MGMRKSRIMVHLVGQPELPERVSRIVLRAEVGIPQGLKPAGFSALFGTTEVVP
jgi:ATP-dependent Clp protease ATP-binding subunit ClpA